VCIGQLLEAEDHARSAQTGHWRDGAFALRTPEQLRNRVGTFQVVEGQVTTASTNKGRAYINFGADYKTDFTVTVEQDDLKLFRQARFDVKKLAGKHVRVRGWVELYNGPEMVVSTPHVHSDFRRTRGASSHRRKASAKARSKRRQRKEKAHAEEKRVAKHQDVCPYGSVARQRLTAYRR
jgi:hypothetical protein